MTPKHPPGPMMLGNMREARYTALRVAADRPAPGSSFVIAKLPERGSHSDIGRNDAPPQFECRHQ